MNLSAADSNNAASIQQVPRADVCILWVDDFYDVPLQGMAEVGGRRCLFMIMDRDSLGTTFESPQYWLVALNSEQLRDEEEWHDLFCRKVGTHFDYTGRPSPMADEVCPDAFYEPYRNRAQPDYGNNEVVGWFELSFQKPNLARPPMVNREVFPRSIPKGGTNGRIV